MTRVSRLLFVGLVLVGGFVVPSAMRRGPVPGEQIPPRLTDAQFWRLAEEASEPSGYFQSDNLLSNEMHFQDVIPELVQRTESGGIYIGVGPEQNFTYIAALKPGMAFIPDVRRGNLQLHLMYKALFELSADRAEFVSRLFTRKRPPQLNATSTADEIFEAFTNVEPTAPEVYQDNLRAIQELLSKKHGFALTSEDLVGIDHVYHNFHAFGPSINYSSSRGGGGFGSFVTYADLMRATDGSNRARSFLASEDNFTTVKDLEARNLIVPVVGDFAGPKAVRAIAAYVKEHNATVTAFYVSNVEQFLYREGTWPDFCRNVATLPLDAKSVFIRSTRRAFATGLVTVLGAMQRETESCAARGR
jgi:hypothetical protein